MANAAAARAGTEAGPTQGPGVAPASVPAALAIFASGNGSNLEALLAACAGGRIAAEVVGVVCNIPGAGAIARARRYEVPVLLAGHGDFASREAHEEAILGWLRPRRPDWIALAGYMRLLSPRFLREYPGRVVNIHPADTRKHQGAGGYEWALREGLRETVVTVHLVDDGMDTGRILAQAPVPIRPNDTIETLRERGLAVEHELFVTALKSLLEASGPRCASVAEELVARVGRLPGSDLADAPAATASPAARSLAGASS